MYKLLGFAVLGAALTLPCTLKAQEHENDRDHRYYDRDRKDYHEWNEREQRAYRHWLEQERHEKYREWNRLNADQQAAYWRWRHEHQDWDDMPHRTR
jgi:hypothetical protein